jgi:hypothetical protein
LYHWIDLGKGILILNIGKDFKVLSRFIKNPSNPPTSADGLCQQTAIISAKPGSKNAGESIIVLWRTARE